MAIKKFKAFGLMEILVSITIILVTISIVLVSVVNVLKAPNPHLKLKSISLLDEFTSKDSNLIYKNMPIIYEGFELSSELLSGDHTCGVFLLKIKRVNGIYLAEREVVFCK